MKKKFSFVAVVGLMMIMIGVCGCGMKIDVLKNSGKKKTEVTLTERQKKILEKEDLPTEYSELTWSQQKAIVAIEEMLTYAEEKYNESFSYAGYHFASPLEEEHMEAYPTGSYAEIGTFTITKTSDGYEDDYMTLAVKPMYIAYLKEEIQKILPDTKIKVYAEITSAELDERPTEYEDLNDKVGAGVIIEIDSNTFDGLDLSDFKNKLSVFLLKINCMVL